MIYPKAEFKPVVNHGGPMSQHLGLVLHVQEGNNSLSGYFNNPASQVSSHFWVSKTGAVEQYVDAGVMAWAQAAGNGTYLSVETEGYSTEPLTNEQIDALAGLYRWVHDTYHTPFATADTPGQAGLAWHGMGGAQWGGHYNCPGSLRLQSRPIILQKASGAVVSPPTPGQPSQPIPGPSKPPAGPTAPPFPGVLLVYTPGKAMITGNEVRQWQQQMHNRGWNISVDGVYGPASETICRQFQHQKGLTVDGVVGPHTWAAAWIDPVTSP